MYFLKKSTGLFSIGLEPSLKDIRTLGGLLTSPPPITNKIAFSVIPPTLLKKELVNLTISTSFRITLFVNQVFFKYNFLVNHSHVCLWPLWSLTNEPEKRAKI